MERRTEAPSAEEIDRMSEQELSAFQNKETQKLTGLRNKALERDLNAALGNQESSPNGATQISEDEEVDFELSAEDMVEEDSSDEEVYELSEEDFLEEESSEQVTAQEYAPEDYELAQLARELGLGVQESSPGPQETSSEQVQSREVRDEQAEKEALREIAKYSDQIDQVMKGYYAPMMLAKALRNSEQLSDIEQVGMLKNFKSPENTLTDLKVLQRELQSLRKELFAVEPALADHVLNNAGGESLTRLNQVRSKLDFYINNMQNQIDLKVDHGMHTGKPSPEQSEYLLAVIETNKKNRIEKKEFTESLEYGAQKAREEEIQAQQELEAEVLNDLEGSQNPERLKQIEEKVERTRTAAALREFLAKPEDSEAINGVNEDVARMKKLGETNIGSDIYFITRHRENPNLEELDSSIASATAMIDMARSQRGMLEAKLSEITAIKNEIITNKHATDAHVEKLAIMEKACRENFTSLDFQIAKAEAMTGELRKERRLKAKVQEALLSGEMKSDDPTINDILEVGEIMKLEQEVNSQSEEKYYEGISLEQKRNTKLTVIESSLNKKDKEIQELEEQLRQLESENLNRKVLEDAEENTGSSLLNRTTRRLLGFLRIEDNSMVMKAMNRYGINRSKGELLKETFDNELQREEIADELSKARLQREYLEAQRVITSATLKRTREANLPGNQAIAS